MTDLSLQELFKRYLDETITREQLARLHELISSGYDQEQLDPLLEAAFVGGQYAVPTDAAQRQQILAGLLDRIMIKELVPGQNENNELIEMYPDRQGDRRHGWRRIGYAAAAAALVSGFALLWFNRHPVNIAAPVAMNKPARDISAPVGAKATLTLSGGQQIILDSAGNGQLAIQGNTRIHKLKNGQLAYEKDNSSPANILYNTLSTTKGGQTTVMLSDGTKVWLNALSSLRYPAVFGKERNVELDGEAYFEVSDDKSKPFKVNIQGRGKIVVLGTHFNVNAYKDEPSVKTTLLEGSVKVERGGAGSVTIRPGQQVQMNDRQLLVNNAVNTEEVIAWKNGYFSFEDAGTEEIMRQVSRWYDVRVIYEGNVKDERFAGSMPRSANASRLLEILALTKTVQFTIEDKTIIVKPFHP